jgi:hypothetical protein
MKVKIKKGAKTREYKLISSWEEVTLEKWVKLAELEGLSKSEEAEGIIEAFSNIPNTLVKGLALPDVSAILNRVAKLQNEKNSSLKKIIEVDGKIYGFHPQLSDITLGEYADIEIFIKNGIDKHLPEIMSVLYRPIVEREGDAYIIEAYDGQIDVRAEKFKKMSAENVESALVFFWIFVTTGLLRTLPLSLMEQMEETKKNLEGKILQTSGRGSE